MTRSRKPHHAKAQRQRAGARILCVLIHAIAIVLGAVALIAASLGAAVLFDSPAKFISAGVLASLLVMLFVSYFALKLWSVQSRWRSALTLSTAATVLLFLGFHMLFQQPLVPETEQFVRHIPEGVELWELRTGSSVAVRKVAGHGDRRDYPIVFVHGGPGGYSVSLKPTTDVVSRLAENGYDVFFYDQIGGGLSARLDDISQYTVDRQLNDLEAIYEQIGARKIILIGSSWGATLSSSYMARNPGHVAAAVFSGASPVYLPHWKGVGDGGLDEKLSPARRDDFARTVETPRLFAALALAELNPKAAVQFASDEELGSLFDKVANEFYLPIAVCGGDNTAVSSGYGFWSNRMTANSRQNRTDDPRPALRKNNTPVLVMRGDCDYKKEAVAKEYVDIFPNAQFSRFETAGHMLLWEEPENYLRQVRIFLADIDD